MEIEQVARRIRQELQTARQALKDGNNGMARVCARRAAGAAIGFWLRENGRTGWGVDAMSHLRHLENEPSFPPEIQTAAARLAAKATPKSSSPSTDPLHDCRIIVEHLLGGEVAGQAGIE